MKMGSKRKNQRRSIGGEIMGSTSLAIFLLIAVCSAIMVFSMKILTNTILLDTMAPMAKEAAKSVESNLHLLADRMMSIALDERLVASTGDKTIPLKWARNTYELYAIVLYGLSGQQVAEDGDITFPAMSQEMLSLLQSTDNLVIGDPELSQDTLAIPVGMPVKRNGETAYYLVGYYKYDALQDVIGNMDIGRTGSAIIINQEGKIVGHPVLDMVKQNLNLFDLDKDEASQAVYRRMISGETGSAEGLITGQKVYIAFAPIWGTRWSLAIDIPKDDYAHISNRAILATLASAVGMVLLALLLVNRKTRMVSRSLGKVTDRITLLADGDLHTQAEVMETRNELELLSGSLKTTIESVNTYLSDIQDVLSHIAQGDLTAQTSVQYQGDFIIIQDSLNHIVDSLNHTMERIRQAGDHLSDMSENLRDESEGLRHSAEQQNDTVRMLVEELDSVKVVLQAVSSSTSAAKEKMDEVTRKITSGNDCMHQLSTAMEEIKKNSDEIYKINKLIEDIAFQTNILALNAAVEASHAGAAGKGFSVVADEVGRLAGQSAEAAKNTSVMIDKSSAVIQKGVSLTKDMGGALDQISKESRVIESLIMGDLSKTVHQQEQSLKQILTHISNISGMADQNMAGAANVAQVSVDVSAEAERLRKMLEEFRIRTESPAPLALEKENTVW